MFKEIIFPPLEKKPVNEEHMTTSPVGQYSYWFSKNKNSKYNLMVTCPRCYSVYPIMDMIINPGTIVQNMKEQPYYYFSLVRARCPKCNTFKGR